MHGLFVLTFRNLGPHFLDILEHHIRVPVKSFDTRQQLFIIPQRDKHLRMITHRLLQDGERTLRNLILL